MSVSKIEEAEACPKGATCGTFLETPANPHKRSGTNPPYSGESGTCPRIGGFQVWYIIYDTSFLLDTTAPGPQRPLSKGSRNSRQSLHRSVPEKGRRVPGKDFVLASLTGNKSTCWTQIGRTSGRHHHRNNLLHSHCRHSLCNRSQTRHQVNQRDFRLVLHRGSLCPELLCKPNGHQ